MAETSTHGTHRTESFGLRVLARLMIAGLVIGLAFSYGDDLVALRDALPLQAWLWACSGGITLAVLCATLVPLRARIERGVRRIPPLARATIAGLGDPVALFFAIWIAVHASSTGSAVERWWSIANLVGALLSTVLVSTTFSPPPAPHAEGSAH